MIDTALLGSIITVVTNIVIATIAVVSMREKMNTLVRDVIDMRIAVNNLNTAYNAANLADVRLEARMVVFETTQNRIVAIIRKDHPDF